MSKFHLVMVIGTMAFSLVIAVVAMIKMRRDRNVYMREVWGIENPDKAEEKKFDMIAWPASGIVTRVGEETMTVNVDGYTVNVFSVYKLVKGDRVLVGKNLHSEGATFYIIEKESTQSAE